MKTKEDIQSLFEQVRAEALQLNIPISANIKEEIYINNRAKSRFGCCKKTRTRFKIIYEIEISERLLGGEDKIIKQTLAHELLHTCTGCDNHGDRWKAYARLMNQTYGYNIKRTEKAENLGIPANYEKIPLEDRYILVCKKCGAQITRTRMSPVIRTPQKYRCKCGGELRRIK